MMDGAERIAAERDRQIDVEGWTADHDDEHSDGDMARAAVVYAAHAAPNDFDQELLAELFIEWWPWHVEWWKPGDAAKPGDRIRCLEKAGALCAAEIDRLLREQEES